MATALVVCVEEAENVWLRPAAAAPLGNGLRRSSSVVAADADEAGRCLWCSSVRAGACAAVEVRASTIIPKELCICCCSLCSIVGRCCSPLPSLPSLLLLWLLVWLSSSSAVVLGDSVGEAPEPVRSKDGIGTHEGDTGPFEQEERR